MGNSEEKRCTRYKPKPRRSQLFWAGFRSWGDVCYFRKEGDPGRTRTFNQLIKSQLLCQLSYRTTLFNCCIIQMAIGASRLRLAQSILWWILFYHINAFQTTYPALHHDAPQKGATPKVSTSGRLANTSSGTSVNWKSTNTT